MKVIIAAPLNPHTGYGQDGLGLALGFRQAGCDVYLDPTSVQAPLPMDVAELLTKRLDAPFDLYLRHTDPSQLEATDAVRRSSAVTVAHTMWEYSTLDNCEGRSSLKKRLRNFDLVVGYDSVTTTAFDRYVTTNAATVQGGYWPKLWPQALRDWNAPTLRFCMVGALGARKDPFVAIDAFRELREEHPDVDIELNIKTNVPGLHSKLQDWIPGLRVFYEVWPEGMLREFYSRQHVLIAPSRGEGKNLPALEMLSTGGTVIATNWGGPTQWLSAQFAYPLDYTLEPLLKSRPECQWAKASKDHLKQLMLHAYDNRDELRRKGDLAANLIPDMCAWPKVIDRLMERVGECNETGERVLHKYRVAKARVEQSQRVLL